MPLYTVQVPKRTLQVLLDHAKASEWEETERGFKFCPQCYDFPVNGGTTMKSGEHAPDCPLGCAIRFATQLLTDPKLPS